MTTTVKRLGVIAASLAIIALAAVLVTTGSANTAAAQEPVDQGLPPNIISAPGTGTASGQPDIAMVQLGVEVTDPNIQTALEQANQRIADVIAALEEAGVPADNIQTVRFDVQQIQDRNPQTGQPVGQPRYQVSNTLQVRIEQTEQVGEILQAAIEVGANQVFGFRFALSDPEALAAEARAAAVENAQAHAEEMAEALGVDLGAPVRITEEAAGGPGPVFAEEAAIGLGGGAVPVQQGQLTVTVQVRGVWALEQ